MDWWESERMCSSSSSVCMLLLFHHSRVRAVTIEQYSMSPAMPWGSSTKSARSVVSPVFVHFLQFFWLLTFNWYNSIFGVQRIQSEGFHGRVLCVIRGWLSIRQLKKCRFAPPTETTRKDLRIFAEMEQRDVGCVTDFWLSKNLYVIFVCRPVFLHWLVVWICAP